MKNNKKQEQEPSIDSVVLDLLETILDLTEKNVDLKKQILEKNLAICDAIQLFEEVLDSSNEY